MQKQYEIYIIAIKSFSSKLFQKSSSLKPLNQFEPILATIILRVSSLRIVSNVPADMAAVTKSRTYEQNQPKNSIKKF